MKMKFLGRTGVQVSELCFGTMSFGGDADKTESESMYRACRDAGINFFDTANMYQRGVAEEYLGEFIKGERQSLILTTKVYFPMSDNPNDMGASSRNIKLSIEASLKRLKTDYIDLYFIHRFDDNTSLEETLGALNILVQQGKVLYLGLSNFAAWQIEKALGIAERKNLSTIHCIQPMYNLVKRQAEVELLPMAKEEGLGVISYSPVGGGLLSGKYNLQTKPEGSRISSDERYSQRYGGQHYFEIAGKYNEFAKKLRVHPVTLAVAWVKSNPIVTSPIIGARNLDQLGASLDAADYELDAERLAELDHLSPAPPPATDRSEET